jgi:FMN-dependent NADH-azoreductase
MKVLQIDSSILGAHSVSRDLTTTVVERLKQGGETVELTRRDLAAEPLGHISVPDLPTEHRRAGPRGRPGRRTRRHLRPGRAGPGLIQGVI